MLYLCYLCRFKPLRHYLRGFLIRSLSGCQNCRALGFAWYVVLSNPLPKNKHCHAYVLVSDILSLHIGNDFFHSFRG